jgi:phosphatidyl-N-methylethanolamine N-methyltransferase
MVVWASLISAILLSMERICYAWVWYRADSFRLLCSYPTIAVLGEPVDVLKNLFFVFKVVQISVFIGWCMVFGEGVISLSSGNSLSLAAGLTCIVVGQTLNISVFYRLGKIGVFYGAKLGYNIKWCNKFPFRIIRHPQYIGTLTSIWGFFLVMRFPHIDWIILPIIETVYYGLGAWVER